MTICSILSDGTGGKLSLFNEPMIRRMGEYMSRSYVGNGWVVNFADASAQGGGDPLLIYRYGKAVNSDEMMHFAAYLLNGRKPYATMATMLFVRFNLYFAVMSWQKQLRNMICRMYLVSRNGILLYEEQERYVCCR